MRAVMPQAAVAAETVAPPFRRDRLIHAFVAVSGLSRAGDMIWTIALAWSAVHLASAATAGAVIAAGTIPRAVVMLYGGVLADRVDALRLMRVTNLVRAAVLLLAAVLMWSGALSVPLLLAVAITFGIADALYMPSSSTLPRQLVRPGDLPAFQGAMQTVQRLGNMGGSVVGGVLVALWGAGTCAALDAATFLVHAAFLAILRPRFPRESPEREPALRALAAGFRHLRRSPTTRALVLTLSGLNLAVTPALDLGVALRSAREGWGAHMVGVAAALVGLGAAIGSLAMVPIKPRRIGLWGFGLLAVQGGCIAALGAGGRIPVAAVCVVLGFTAGAASVSLSALFLSVVDQAYLGRMSSLTSLGDDALMPLSMAAFGALASVTSASVPFYVYGAAMAGLMVMILARPVIRRLRIEAAVTADEVADPASA